MLLLLLLDEKMFWFELCELQWRRTGKAIGKGMPDYYLRYRNRVFGCKDVQMAAKMKLSGDYETIKKQFLRSMSQIPRGMRKGVAVGKYDW